MPDPSTQIAPSRRRLGADERRALIVEAAGHEFGERGYAATRLEDIAAASQVTKPILYRHFTSKKDLYLALLARHRDDLDGFLPTGGGGEALGRQLPAILDGWLHYVETHSYAWRMLFRDSSGDAEIQAFRGRVQDRARQVFVEMIEAGEDAFAVPRSQVVPVAELLRSALAGLVLWWLDHPEVPRQVILDSITSFAARLLTPTR